MAKLIICLDGTWNGIDDKFATNIKKIYDLLEGETKRLDKNYSEDAQFKYYHPGVGSEGTYFEKITGGAIALGIESIIKSSYAWLGRNYKKGDKIYIFGFSRGALAGTILSDLIIRVGLLDFSYNSLDKDMWNKTDKIFDIYKDGNLKFPQEWVFHQFNSEKNEIEFLGVFDTVEAYIGDYKELVAQIFKKSTNKKSTKRLLGNDFKISKQILNARHALSLDEKRIPFTPLVWKGIDRIDKKVKQIWFSGVHCDIGGGYEDSTLSNITLKWMVDEVNQLNNKLKFKPNLFENLDKLKIDSQALIHDSYTEFYKKFTGSQPRSIPNLSRNNKDSFSIHPSVFERMDNPPLGQGDYRLQREFDSQSKSITLNIYASREWNETGIYIEKNKYYKFSTRGEWFDGNDSCDSEGMIDSIKNGRIENSNFPWFCMVGMVAMGGESTGNCSAMEYEPFIIKKETIFHSNWEGYLYCFANDKRNYEDNKGRIELTIEILEELKYVKK